MTKDIEHRKRDHLILAQDRSLNFSISAGFDQWRFIHNALPEIDLQDVDTSTQFLGKRLSIPLLISSMSGGVKEGLALNATLAEAAEATGCALGLGSIRAALEDDALGESFLIARERAPRSVILANIGIGQILKASSMDPISRFCEALKADGLIIHLNSLQEAMQSEGDTRFRGALEAIRNWTHDFPLPLVVKEVGQGLSLRVIQQLEQVGVQYIDIAGAGGSNWINIESQRLRPDEHILKEAAKSFKNWGEPTAEVLSQIKSNATIIASGGIQSAVDMAKALGLGAALVGVAGPFLKLGLSGDSQQLIHEIEVWKKTLALIMFGTGMVSVSDLIGNRAILSPCSHRYGDHEYCRKETHE